MLVPLTPLTVFRPNRVKEIHLNISLIHKSRSTIVEYQCGIIFHDIHQVAFVNWGLDNRKSIKSWTNFQISLKKGRVSLQKKNCFYLIFVSREFMFRENKWIRSVRFRSRRKSAKVKFNPLQRNIYILFVVIFIVFFLRAFTLWERAD